MTMKMIYFIRHGEILSNKLKIYTGQSNEDLNGEGVIQARRVGRLLKTEKVCAIYSSPMRRAKQTAEIIAGYIDGLKVVVEDNLREMSLGHWEGLSEDLIAIRYPEEYKTWWSRPAELKSFGRESLTDVQDRIVKTAYKILSRHNNNVVAVTHVAVIRCLYLFCNFLGLNSYKKIEVPNASVFGFSLNNGHAECNRLF